MKYRENTMYVCVMDHLEIFKALSNQSRLQILNWLKEPAINFPEQKERLDLGVCVGQIHKKLNLTQSTVSEYLSILQRAGLVTSTRIGKWTYYKRNEEVFRDLGNLIQNDI